MLPSRPTRRLLVRAMSLVAGLSVAACLSPTLPLPPPEAPEVQQIGQGQYRLTGRIPIPGKILVLDLRSRLLFGTLADDGYQFAIQAHPGDNMRAYYESGDDVSDYREFVIDEALVSTPVQDGGVGAGNSHPDGGVRTQPADAHAD